MEITDKLRLTNLAKEEMQKREMNMIVGGKTCTCSCIGPSGSHANMNANYDKGIPSVGGCQSWFTSNGGVTSGCCLCCDEKQPYNPDNPPVCV